MHSESRLLLLAGGVWALGVAAGIGWLASYSWTPGPTPAPQETWPAASAIPRRPGRPTLLLFAHPRCPCTRASADNFASLARRFGATTDLAVVFVRPPGVPAGWEEGELRDRVADIAGAVAVLDEGGREARLFGVRTSGHVLLYDACGRLAWSGGITAARGHAGESVGLNALSALLAASGTELRPAAQVPPPAYGCSLLARDAGGAGCSGCEVTTASVVGRSP